MGVKKGFFFIVLALVILSLMAFSLFLWSEQSKIQYSIEKEKFKLNSFQTPFLFISEEKLNNIANISAIYAVNKLSDALIFHPQKIKGIYYHEKSCFPSNFTPSRAQIGDECLIYYVNKSIFELMFYGNTSGYLVSESGQIQPYFYKIYNFNYSFNPSNFITKNLTYSDDERIYTFSNYFEKTHSLAKGFGYDLIWGIPENFSIKHLDYRTLNVVFYLPVKLTSSNFKLEKKIKVNTSFNIDGLPDPYLAIRYRQRINDSLLMWASQLTPYKNVYFSPAYPNATVAAARLITTGSQGLGWFYGPVVVDPIDSTKFSFNNPILNRSKIDQFIFATTNASKAREQSVFFGAVILYGVVPYDQVVSTTPFLVTQEQNCIWCLTKKTGILGISYSFYAYPLKRDIPFIIIPGDINSVLTNVKPNVRTGLKEILITSNIDISHICDDYNSSSPNCVGQHLTSKNYQYSKASIYDLNGPRDMAICGFYVPSEYGLSYLQRFTAFDYQDLGNTSNPISQFGIESFEVGAWAAGYLSSQFNLQQTFESSSRLDYHFLLTRTTAPLCRGTYIKGMPGCKNAQMAGSLDPFYNGTGRFALTNKSSNPTFRYNLFNLTLSLPLNVDCR